MEFLVADDSVIVRLNGTKCGTLCLKVVDRCTTPIEVIDHAAYMAAPPLTAEAAIMRVMRALH